MQTSTETGFHYNPLMPIDTLAVSKRLQSAGMPKEQAEMQAEVLGEIITQNLASKTDIENIRKDIETLRIDSKVDIETLRKDSKADIETLRKDSKADIEIVRKDIEILRKDSKVDIEIVRKDIEILRKDSKADIEIVRKDIEILRKDLTIEIEKIKTDIMKWIIPLMAGQLAATAGLFKFFTH